MLPAQPEEDVNVVIHGKVIGKRLLMNLPELVPEKAARTEQVWVHMLHEPLIQPGELFRFVMNATNEMTGWN